MEKDLKRLEMFLKDLPADTPAVFDFRHPTWFDDDVLALLRSQNRVLCVSDTDEFPANHIDKTADWGYVRLRRVNYSEAELAEVGQVACELRSGRTLSCSSSMKMKGLDQNSRPSSLLSMN